MKMRELPIALVLVALATVAATADSADKVLQNNKGSVSYQLASGAPKPVGVNAQIVLGDKDYAITGDQSLASVVLPDSSKVLVGSSSKVQLAAFNQAQGTTAKFIVVDGKVRFMVQHPAGAKANYTFQTATGTIAVRGTEGDIAYDNNSLQVNVYETCDASLPVTVTTKDGKRFNVLAGQSFAAALVNGIVQEQVTQLTQQAIDQFTSDFPVPTSWDAATGQIVSYASNTASNAANQATGGLGGGIVGDQVGNAIGGLFNRHKSTPTPSPSPRSETCTHA